MRPSLLEKYIAKTGRYDKFVDRLDAALPGGRGICHYCPRTITTAPEEYSWNVCRAHFHHTVKGEIVALCGKCHKQIHGGGDD